MSASLKPLIIQGDRSILLDVHAPEATEARFALIPFAELEKSPEHLHTYRLTGLSLWNAASAGFTAETSLLIITSGIHAAAENSPQRIRADRDVRGSAQ